MIRRLFCALVAVLTASVLLAGCSTPASPAEPSGSTSRPSTPSPTPSVMSTPEAATYYLDTVCPSNALVNAANAAVNSFDAGTGDIASVNATSAAARDSSQAAALRLDDASVKWPENVAPDIPVIRDAYFSQAASYGQWAQATDANALNATAWADQTAASQASQRVRARLSLPADTVASCAGR